MKWTNGDGSERYGLSILRRPKSKGIRGYTGPNVPYKSSVKNGKWV